MKFKKLVLVTLLLLAILTIGAVSAGGDNNDTLTVVDDGDAVANSVDEVTAQDDTNEVLSYEKEVSVVEANESVTPADFFVGYDDTITNIENPLIWIEDFPADGKLSISVNNFSAFTESMYKGETIYLSPWDLGINDFGLYSVMVKFKPADSEELTLKEFDFQYGVDSGNDSFIVINDVVDFSYYGALIAYVKDRNLLNGTVTLSIDGREFYSKQFNGAGTVAYIQETDLFGYMLYHDEFVGNRTVKVTYNNLSKESVVSFEIVPIVIKPTAVAAGERSYVLFEAEDNFMGIVSVYDTLYNNVTNEYAPNSLLVAYPISASAKEVPLPELTPGYHVFYTNYTVNGRNYSMFFRVLARENSQNFTANISACEISEGGSVTVNVTGPKTGGIDFLVDGYGYPRSSLADGSVERIFSDLTAGAHVIFISYYSESNDLFFSRYFHVTVSKVQNAKVVDITVDVSTTSVYGELVLTDISTGEVFKINITSGSINSTYANPGNISSNITEIVNQLLNLAQIWAGGKTVTVKSQNISNASGLGAFDNRTYTWKDADDLSSIRHLEIGGEYGRLWQANVTVIAEYSSGAVDIANADLELSKTAFVYNAKVQKPAVTLTDGVLLKEGVDYTLQWPSVSPKNVGKYVITVTGIGNYGGTVNATFNINKAANPLKVSAKIAYVKFSTLKKKKQVLSVSKVVKFTKKGQGTLTYAKSSGNKKITINKKNGQVAVAKGLKKGTYKVKVKIKAKGNANYNASAYKTVTFKIIVK